MTQYVTARFEAQICEDVSREEICSALNAVLDAIDRSFEKAVQEHVITITEKGDLHFDFQGDVFDSFDEAFDESADAVALLAEEAFETELQSDDGPTAAGSTFNRVVGPTEESVQRFKQQGLRSDLDAAMQAISAHLPRAVGQAATEDDRRRQSGLTFSLIEDGQNQEMEPAVSVDLSYVSDPDVLRQIESHAHFIASLIAQSRGNCQLFSQRKSRLPKVDLLDEFDRALLAIGPGNWKEGGFFDLGDSVERTFVDETKGKEVAVRLDLDGQVLHHEMRNLGPAKLVVRERG